jgi:protein-S-isoprenylcysteine O-methyltransferase Ste14
MGNSDLSLIFRITAGFLLIMQTGSRLWMTRQKQSVSDSRFVHREREQFFIRLTGGAMMLAYLYAFLPDTTGVDFQIHVSLRWAGAVLMLVGNILFIQAHVYLGRQWSPELEIQPEHQLIIRGVYRRIRHPMYTGFLLFGLGLVLLSANLFGCAYLPAIATMLIVRLPAEEALLIEEFGQAYRDYQKNTAALIPGLF